MGDIVNAVLDVFDLGPASKQAKATTEAAGMSAQSAREALALQQRMYEEGVARQKPFYEAGVNALPGYLSGIGPNGELVRGFTMADYQADPGYAFRLSEGQKAIERSTAARTGLQSGAALKAAARYGQEMGSQEFSNAYQRFRDTQGLRRNALAGVVGYAPTAAGAMTTSGQNFANQANQLAMTNAANQGNLALQMGNVRASQYGTAGSALNTALNTDWNALGRRFGYGGGGGGVQGFGQVNPSSGEYMGSLEF
jgi:hypothetical protein